MTTTAAVHLAPAQRDKYGRSTVSAYFGRFAFDGPTQAVMVTLPKVYRETRGHSHLVSMWAGPVDANGHTAVFYASSRKEALSILHREVAALHA